MSAVGIFLICLGAAILLVCASALLLAGVVTVLERLTNG